MHCYRAAELYWNVSHQVQIASEKSNICYYPHHAFPFFFFFSFFALGLNAILRELLLGLNSSSLSSSSSSEAPFDTTSRNRYPLSRDRRQGFRYYVPSSLWSLPSKSNCQCGSNRPASDTTLVPCRSALAFLLSMISWRYSTAP
eukprot:COSAG05_NODE_2219_length_3375_cov_231.829879_3_plen_144_part_00